MNSKYTIDPNSPSYKHIKTNNDWVELKKDSIVDISNDSYFGFRAMEKESKIIIYDPILINNFERIIKDARKFSKTLHVFEIDFNLLPKKTLEEKINMITKRINYSLKINSKIKIGLLFKGINKDTIIPLIKVFSIIYDLPFGFYKDEIISEDIDLSFVDIIKK